MGLRSVCVQFWLNPGHLNLLHYIRLKQKWIPFCEIFGILLANMVSFVPILNVICIPSWNNYECDAIREVTAKPQSYLRQIFISLMLWERRTQGVDSDSDHIKLTPAFWQSLKFLTSFLNRVRPRLIEVFFHSLNKHKGRIHPLLKYSVSYPWPHTHPELWELFLGRPRSADHWVWCNISCVVESNQHQHFKRAEDRLHAASYCDFWEAQWGVKVAVFNLALNVKSKRIYPPDVFLCVCV